MSWRVSKEHQEELDRDVAARIVEADGEWVTYQALREAYTTRMPWERPVHVADDGDGHGYNDARGSAWLGESTGERDFSPLGDAVGAAKRAHTIEEGYPSGVRAFRLIKS